VIPRFLPMRHRAFGNSVRPGVPGPEQLRDAAENCDFLLRCPSFLKRTRADMCGGHENDFAKSRIKPDFIAANVADRAHAP
jgi:hypothetical protein